MCFKHNTEVTNVPIDPSNMTVTYLTHGNAEIVVYRPILDDKERKKREANLQRALAAFGRAMVEAERKAAR